MDDIGIFFTVLCFAFLICFFILCKNVSDIKKLLEEKKQEEIKQISKPKTDKKA